jgi:hypothetical protein
MRKGLIAFVLLGLALIFASPTNVSSVPTKPAMPERGRLDQLPDLTRAWHTSIFVHSDYQNRPEEKALVEAFDTVPELADLKGKTTFHVYTADSPHYRERLRKYYPVLPAVVVQRADGSIYFKASGPAATAGAIGAAATLASANYRCDGGKCYPIDEPDPAERDRGKEVPDQGSLAGLSDTRVNQLLGLGTFAALAYMAWKMKPQ